VKKYAAKCSQRLLGFTRKLDDETTDFQMETTQVCCRRKYRERQSSTIDSRFSQALL
jgi:hypothetical protein